MPNKTGCVKNYGPQKYATTIVTRRLHLFHVFLLFIFSCCLLVILMIFFILFLQSYAGCLPSLHFSVKYFVTVWSCQLGTHAGQFCRFLRDLIFLQKYSFFVIVVVAVAVVYLRTYASMYGGVW